MRIEGANPNATSAETEALPADKPGDPTQSSFNYECIVGMLQYLQCHMSDIQFTVRQCSRFKHQHMNMHITAIQGIGRHIMQTSRKGIILQPKSETTIDCYDQ